MTDSVILVPWQHPETFLPPLTGGTRYATFTVDDHDLPPEADRAVLYVTPYTFATRPHEVMRDMPALRASNCSPPVTSTRCRTFPPECGSRTPKACTTQARPSSRWR